VGLDVEDLQKGTVGTKDVHLTGFVTDFLFKSTYT
jgi:hypothetical protein